MFTHAIVSLGILKETRHASASDCACYIGNPCCAQRAAQRWRASFLGSLRRGGHKIVEVRLVERLACAPFVLSFACQVGLQEHVRPAHIHTHGLHVFKLRIQVAPQPTPIRGAGAKGIQQSAGAAGQKIWNSIPSDSQLSSGYACQPSALSA
jgi:hypothetical protein